MPIRPRYLTVGVLGFLLGCKTPSRENREAGQALAVIQSPQVTAAAADLAQDKARRVHDEQALARAQRLFQSGAGSAREVEEATAALQQTKVAEERDLSALSVLGGVQNTKQPSYVPRIPVTGTVTERRAALGAGVQSDDAAACGHSYPGRP